MNGYTTYLSMGYSRYLPRSTSEFSRNGLKKNLYNVKTFSSQSVFSVYLESGHLDINKLGCCWPSAAKAQSLCCNMPIYLQVNPPSDLNFTIIDERNVQMSWKRPPDAIVGYRITVVPTNVNPPSDLNFTIIDERNVQMSWKRPPDAIVGYRITVVPTNDGPTKEFTLSPSTTQTVISDLIPDIEYVVSISSYDEREESLPVFGQLTRIKAADAKELKLIASQPSLKHVFNVANFDGIVDIQNEIILQVCSGVDEQLGELVSGEEVVEPPSNLVATQISSKSVRITWDPSTSQITGYRLQFIPMIAGGKQHMLSVGPQTTALNVKDLSPDTEYQINVYAMKGLTPSEPITIMEKTQQVKVQVECSRGVDVKADVVFLVDGSYSIGIANFVKVRAFLEVLVKSFEISPRKVQISLVQYSRDPYMEFSLNRYNRVEDIIQAINTFPYRGGSTNTGKAMTYVREKVFVTSKGSRPNVPRVMILITDGKSSDAFKEPAVKLRDADVEIFAVGVKDAVRTELEAIASPPAETHVYTVEDFDAFQRISFELTQSVCLRIEQELAAIRKKSYVSVKNMVFSDVTSDSFKVSWSPAGSEVLSYLIKYKVAVGGDEFIVSVPASSTSSVLTNLLPETTYAVSVISEYEDGDGPPLDGEETTLEIKGAPRNLRITDETTDSFVVGWTPAPGNVLRYRLVYQPLTGGERRQVTVSANERSTTLQNLIQDTRYEVSVIPEYQSGPGNSLSGYAKTDEVRGHPRNLRVSDATTSTMRLSWSAAPGKVQQYFITYTPVAGGETKEVTVKGDTNSKVLKGLDQATRLSFVTQTHTL
ncbi:collagen alpha-1 chain isoform x1 [Limosa lapponica baueri]|uniref:Collagen alpha-1 chain isoform x1 n=1 Tax=Limosa lapponica baueri TaxID=1758121 RepID=A0A2I0TF13_LIMLA|nr:collagen alpha-1 chain isoform x1 [Limosa lapponica baueri]